MIYPVNIEAQSFNEALEQLKLYEKKALVEAVCKKGKELPNKNMKYTFDKDNYPRVLAEVGDEVENVTVRSVAVAPHGEFIYLDCITPRWIDEDGDLLSADEILLGHLDALTGEII